VLETPVVRPRGTEVSALGAAYLAGLGIGLLDLETIADHWAVERRCEPQMDRQVVCELRKGWQRAVERSRGWAKFDGPR
jgi:glycerol kinase